MQMFMSYQMTVKMTGSWNGYPRLCVLVCLFANSVSDVVASRCVCAEESRPLPPLPRANQSMGVCFYDSLFLALFWSDRARPFLPWDWPLVGRKCREHAA